MIFKKNRKIRYLISIQIIFLLIIFNISTSASIFKEEFNSDIKDDEVEWFDGGFTGCWGEDKQYCSGEIIGKINVGRNPSVGRFFGEWNKSIDNSSGSLTGIFRKHILIGTLQNNEIKTRSTFVGFIDNNKTGFTAVIFSLKISKIYIKGEYETSFLPPINGLYGVGVKSIHLIDESRLEEFTPEDPDDFREMMIQIWYPIDKEILEPDVEYMDAPTFAWLKGRSPIPLFTIPDNAYIFVNPHGKNEIPISNNQDMYPIIIFSPGYDGVYQIYTSLIEDIVSNGFIVVSINHPYISGITVFPDGREVYISPDPPGNLSLRSVVDDAKFVLDTVFQMNSSDPFFQGRFDLSKIGMYGHSFGGASTSICCYEDNRFLCGLTLDGVFYMDSIPDGINQPFLLMIADNRFNDDNVQDMWNNLNGDGYKVEIEGSTHYAFTDVGVLLDHLVPLVPIRLLGFGTIEPKRHVNITRDIETMFFEVYLKGRSYDDLINLLSSYNDVQFEYK